MEQEGVIVKINGNSKKTKVYELSEFGREVYDCVIQSSPMYRADQFGSLEFLESSEFEDMIQERYADLSLRDLKMKYEIHKRITEILAGMLQSRILEEPIE